MKIHDQFVKSLNKNWMSPEEQKRVKKLMGGELTNAMRSQYEVYLFKRDRPQKYFAYHNIEKKSYKKITTFTGQKLGDITYVGSVYRSNMGDRRVNIRVKAITGDRYHGTAYIDSGDYARLTKLK